MTRALCWFLVVLEWAVTALSALVMVANFKVGNTGWGIVWVGISLLGCGLAMHMTTDQIRTDRLDRIR